MIVIKLLRFSSQAAVPLDSGQEHSVSVAHSPYDSRVHIISAVGQCICTTMQMLTILIKIIGTPEIKVQNYLQK